MATRHTKSASVRISKAFSHLRFLFFHLKSIPPPCIYIVFIDWFLERRREVGRERDRERERETSICCSTYLCIHWLILICPLTGTEPTTLVYQDNAPTNWTTRPGCVCVCLYLYFKHLANFHNRKFLTWESFHLSYDPLEITKACHFLRFCFSTEL